MLCLTDCRYFCFKKEQAMVHGYLVKAKAYREQYPDDNVVTSDLRLWIIQNYGTWLPESCYKLIQDYGTWLPMIMLEQC